MAISRKDPKGRKLREGENWRNDGRYSYRYTDVRTGKRLTVYAQDLPELREKEKQIAKDMEDNILTDGAIKKMTLYPHTSKRIMRNFPKLDMLILQSSIFTTCFILH